MTAIDDKYAAVGGATILGEPLGAEEPTRDGQGRFRRYRSGAIYSHPMAGVHEVHGAIAARWLADGAENGPLGYPLTDESAAAQGARFNHFMNGSVYWRAATGAHPIPRQLFDKWETMGWESSIGFPVADPVDLGDGEVHQVFERAIMSWGPQRGVRVVSRPAATRKLARVFLVGWADLAPPTGYTREFFERYFFGVGEPITDPDGDVIPGSAADYFFHVSDGTFALEGRVDDWVASGLNVTDVPHYQDGVVYPPDRVRLLGATVSEALRGRGIRSRADLLVDGRLPDVLVFVSLDVWAGGGAQRSMRDVKAELQESGQSARWQPGWDEVLDLPVIHMSGCQQTPAPTARADGTFAARPVAARIRWARYSVAVHELVHALLGMGFDIYGGGAWQFNSWFEVMSFSVGTDQPVLMSSYLQERCGFLTIEDLPRRSHRDLLVDPLDTHSAAFRLQNGPLADAETLVFENRSRWDYNQQPPPRLPNVLVAYTLDPQRRRLQETGARVTGRLLSRPGGPWPDTWGTTEAPALLGTGAGLGNTLNHLGERWWELRNIRVRPDSSMLVDVSYQPVDLLRAYLTASWTNGAGAPLVPDVFGGPKGHVMMVGRSRVIEAGQRFDKVLSLHPDWVPGGRVTGRYAVRVPASGARLYLTCALSEEAHGSDGITCSVSVGATTVLTQPLTLERNIRTLVVDLTAHRGATVDVGITFAAGATGNRDWAHLLQAVVVPTATPVADLLAATRGAQYRGSAGLVALNGATGAGGTARTVAQVALQNGQVHAAPVLNLAPAARDDGFVEASFRVTVPAGNTVLRAEMGFDEQRTVTDNGVVVSAAFEAEGARTPLVMSGRLSRLPVSGERGLEANPALTFAQVLPAALAGRTGRLVLRVDADGSAVQDSVYWTMARLTAD